VAQSDSRSATVTSAYAIVTCLFFAWGFITSLVDPLVAAVKGIFHLSDVEAQLSASAFFIAYGVLAGAVATFLLYLLSLPINVIRLRQMLSLVKKARVSAQGDLSMEWLRPFMTPRKFKKGEVLFHKGDVAKEMFYTVSGKFLVKEIGIELPPGRVMGELGFIDPNNRRTGTVESLESGEVLTITYDRLLELYFQNPEFGYYLLRLTAERLMQNTARLETTLSENKTKLLAFESPAKAAG